MFLGVGYGERYLTNLDANKVNTERELSDQSFKHTHAQLEIGRCAPVL